MCAFLVLGQGETLWQDVKSGGISHSDSCLFKACRYNPGFVIARHKNVESIICILYIDIPHENEISIRVIYFTTTYFWSCIIADDSEVR